jgi:protein-disulfide isomerase
MKKIIFILTILSSLLFISGCSDKASLKDIKDTQTEILKTQRDILTKLTTLESNVKNVQARPKRPAIDYNKVHAIPVGKSAIKGKVSAPVTIVEFSDFQCPYCARLQPTLKEVLKAYPEEVRLVYKHYPLSFHKQARNAAKATEAAREQGKFWEMHDLIFENFNKLTENMFSEFAQKLGLDSAKFKADYASNKYDNQIQADISIARNVSVTGTPTLFMNGKRMQRRSTEDFKEAIDKILKKK